MIWRSLLTAAVSLSIPMASANAQNRSPALPPPGPINQGPDINPAHERMKSEAESAYHGGSFDRSIELTSTVIGQASRDHVAYYLRGSAKVEKGIRSRNAKLIRDGINDARLAINYGGTEPSVAMYYLPYLYGMTNLGALEGRKEHAEVSLTVASQALKNPSLKSQDRANILYQKGLTESQLQKYDNAAQTYAEAVRLVDTHLGAHIGLADSYARAGRKEQAKAAFDKTIKTVPSNPLVYNNRGLFLQQNGRLDEAIIDFTRALELDPRFVTAQTNRGFTLMESGKPDAAETDFTASLKTNPNQSMVYSLRGTSRLSQGKLKEAIEDYTKVTSLDSKNPIAHADLGFAKYFAGDLAGAEGEFSKALALDGKQRQLGPWLYLAMARQGKGDAARSRFASELGKAASQRDWIDQLMQHVAGRTTPQQLIASAQVGDAKVKPAQTCEAQFFIGQLQEYGGQSDQARTHYQSAIATGQKQLSAFRGSQLALTRQTAQQ